jgi:hypothetical protein
MGNYFSLGDTNPSVHAGPTDVIERSLIHHGIRCAQTLRQNAHRVQRQMQRAADQKSSCEVSLYLRHNCFREREQELRMMSKIVLPYEPQDTAIDSLRKRCREKDWQRRRERELS